MLDEYGKFKYLCAFNFISSKDTGEIRIIYVWSNNESIMRGRDTDDIIRELFRSFLRNYQEEFKILKEPILYLKVLSEWIINSIEYV